MDGPELVTLETKALTTALLVEIPRLAETSPTLTTRLASTLVSQSRGLMPKLCLVNGSTK